MTELKLYSVKFEGVYPVGCHLFLFAESKKEAKEIAEKTITHTEVIGVREVKPKKGVMSYASGDY